MRSFKIIFILTAILLTACSPRLDFKLYEGRPLTIAVIGEIPKVKEDQINFETIDFNYLLKEDLKKFDAVFIMKENLSQASENQYADIYLNTNLPFFFMEATKTYHSFIEKDLSYEDAFDLKENSNHYAIGFLSSEGEDDRYWYYGLYNNQNSPETIKEMYSRIFSTIESSN